jgi:hypothetical protein
MPCAFIFIQLFEHGFVPGVDKIRVGDIEFFNFCFGTPIITASLLDEHD